MVRSTYRQSSGNPLQFDRLPPHSPRLAFPYRVPPLSKTGTMLFKLSIRGLIVIGISAVVTMASAGYGFLDEAMLLAVIVMLAILAAKRRDPIWLTIPLPAVFIIYACLVLPLPSAMLVLICSVILGRLTWLFGRHWTGASTASPLERETGRWLRRRWDGYLLVVALLPPVAFTVGLTIGSLPLALLLATCVMLVQLGHAVFHPRRATIPKTIISSLVSWSTYNQHHNVLPGMLRSPAGIWYHRIVWTLATVTLVTVTGIRTTTDAGLPFAITGGDAEQADLFPEGPFDSYLQAKTAPKRSGHRRKGVDR